MWSLNYTSPTPQDMEDALSIDEQPGYLVISIVVSAMGAYTGSLFLERVLLQTMSLRARMHHEERRKRRQRQSESQATTEQRARLRQHEIHARRSVFAAAFAFGLNTAWGSALIALLGCDFLDGSIITVVRYNVWETLVSLLAGLACTVASFLLVARGRGSICDASSGLVEARYGVSEQHRAPPSDAASHSHRDGNHSSVDPSSSAATLRPRWGVVSRQLLSTAGVRLFVGGLLLGTGIALVHFLALQAVRAHARVIVAPGELVGVFLACVAIGEGAMFCMFYCHGPRMRLPGALAIAGAVSIFHLTSLRILHVIPEPVGAGRGLFRVLPGSETEWTAGGQQLVSAILVVSFTVRFLLFTS